MAFYNSPPKTSAKACMCRSSSTRALAFPLGSEQPLVALAVTVRGSLLPLVALLAVAQSSNAGGVA